MDDNAKATFRGTVIGAILALIGTVFAAYLNFIKPTEKQVVTSDPYKIMAEANDALRSDIRDFHQRINTIEAENLQLQNEVSSVRTNPAVASTDVTKEQQAEIASLQQRLKALESENAELRKPVRVKADQNTTLQRDMQDSDAIGSTSPQPLKLRRVELSLPPGIAQRISEELTVTSEPFYPSYGLTLVINGKKRTGINAGERVSVSKTSSEECFLEVMSLPLEKQTTGGKDIRVEYVCRQLS